MVDLAILLQKLEYYGVRVNGYPIVRDNYVKYLGLYIDEHFKWSEHVN
ncbi:hypothetical protein PR048_031643 [Dryococelus australis]|uniref:Uncharacterized protein n=1 Tax=Dryococelus australis TaxID=614101 RepID=A0ABQ9G8T0_9NEOP|nr:hypothetical protein PR048_031643 [Dryococelus australis]